MFLGFCASKILSRLMACQSIGDSDQDNWGTGINVTTSVPGQLGTALAASFSQIGGEQGDLFLFYQTNGTDIISNEDKGSIFFNQTLPVRA